MRAPMTVVGAKRLREELEHLKSVKRPEIIAAIAEARAHGDLKENAEYHAAREQQGFVEGRIKELESALSHAQLIDVAKLNAGSKIVFGATWNWPTATATRK
jgi:transcription elongation factor GreA